MVLKIIIGAIIGITLGLGVCIFIGSIPIPPCERITYVINSDLGWSTWTVRRGVCILTFNGQDLLPWLDRRWLISGVLIPGSLIAWVWAHRTIYRPNPEAEVSDG